jgi:hypothetical protein
MQHDQICPDLLQVSASCIICRIVASLTPAPAHPLRPRHNNTVSSNYVLHATTGDPRPTR